MEVVMIYTDPIDNITQIVRDVGIVDYVQLAIFFSDNPDLSKKRFDRHIAWLKERGMITHDPKSGNIIWYDAKKTIPDSRTRFVTAFWVISYFGSSVVYGVNVLKFPFCFEVILDINGKKEVYDIAVCNDTMEAAIAARELQRMKIPGTKDTIVHLVVVPDEDIGKQLEPYGFDSFVVLREEYSKAMRLWRKTPEFFQWSRKSGG